MNNIYCNELNFQKPLVLSSEVASWASFFPVVSSCSRMFNFPSALNITSGVGSFVALCVGEHYSKKSMSMTQEIQGEGFRCSVRMASVAGVLSGFALEILGLYIEESFDERYLDKHFSIVPLAVSTGSAALTYCCYKKIQQNYLRDSSTENLLSEEV